MKTKLFEQLKTKCKDFGLSKKALEEIVEIGASELTDESSDDDIAAKADSLVPFAKAMQGEITRKTRKQSKQKSSEDEDDDEGKSGSNDDVTEMFRKLNERLDAVEKENKQLKDEKFASERASLIADKAKKLGIDEAIYKRLHFAEDADIDKELSELKQDLVNASLMGKGQAHEIGLDETQAKADAKAWAQSLGE